MIAPNRPAVRLSLRLVLTFIALSLFFCGAASSAERARALPEAFGKTVPQDVKDLQQIQAHVNRVVDRVLASTVALRIGPAQGSGVIIDDEGHVLTAGHVSGEPGRKVEIVLHDGRKLRGVTLGGNAGIDSGLVRITDKARFSHAEMASSAELKKGQWCVSLGHPGGFQAGRAAVVRLGRVLELREQFIRTDCALVGGDSGGPLFDMHGKVVGIHSRIGQNITYNIHVPIDTYRETWDRLAAAETWGSDIALFDFDRPAGAYLGVTTDFDQGRLRIATVVPGSPAEKAGLQPDDVILRIDRQRLDSLDDLDRVLGDALPGAEVTLRIRRSDETRSLSVVLGKRPD